MSNESAAPGVRPAAELRLEPLAASVREARRFLREQLRLADRERWADAAELALSEVVTNGVLHAHTELTVRVRVLADGLEVEVADTNPGLPVQRRAHDAEATTGRGLELVAALTQDCGVRPDGVGKVVWFRVSDEAAADEPTDDQLLDAWDADGAWESDEQFGDGLDADVQHVVLKAMPTTLWLAAREHHQAVMRELVLYLAEHADTLAAPLDLVRADEARNLIWAALVAEIDRARAAGTARRPLPASHPSPLPDVPESVDLWLAVPPGVGSGFGAFQDAMDTGEQLAVADRLLVRPGLPEIIAVRDWACEQVVAQLAGVPAAPWPGTDQAHFTELVHDRADPAAPQWDSSVVTASERGVVAADDANRIIAISEPLARTVGWDPAEIVGRRVVALIPPELREAHVLGVMLELPVLCKDGSQVTCSFLVERATVGTGRPVYLAWIEPAAPEPDGS